MSSKLRAGSTAAVMVSFVLMAAPSALHAQFGRGGPPPVQGRDGAPIDITGYWTALITDDWQYRMITPQAGDYSYVPLNAEGRRIADASLR